MQEDLGKVVWQERPLKFVFLARAGKRMFTLAEVKQILDEMRDRQREFMKKSL